MKVIKIAVPVLVVLVLVLVLLAPIGPLPGLFIGGTPTPAPAEWGELADVDEILLRVPGAPQRVVIIWVVEYDGDLYVVGSNDSGWVKLIGSRSPVDVRIGDETYALRATPVRVGWQAVLAAYVAKYEADYPDIIAGFPPMEEAVSGATVFRLSRS